MTCAVKTCPRQVAGSSDLCRLHHLARARGEEWNRPARKLQTNAGKKCKQADCCAPALALGLCRRHYQRQHYGLPMDRPPRPRICGGVRLPSASIPRDVWAAISSEAEARHLSPADVIREQLTAVARMRDEEREELMAPKSDKTIGSLEAA